MNINIIYGHKGINDIKSRFVVTTIFEYIKDDKYKLFLHSKKLRRKLDIELIDYEANYLSRIGITLSDYLSDYTFGYPNFNKDNLKKKLNTDIYTNKTYIINDKNFYIKYFTKFKNTNNDSNTYIDIYSPYFNSLSKMKDFGALFTITLPIELIKKYNLKNEYASIFDKLNRSNSQYSSLLIICKNPVDIYYLKGFNINFNQIKKVIIEENDKNEKKDNILFKALFSLNIIENNLSYLNLKFYLNEIEPKLFEKLNNFVSLEYLELEGFKFKTTFIIKLANLKQLKLLNCNNISFTDNCCLNIKQLYLYKCLITKQESLLRFPNLEECILEYLFLYDKIIRYNSIIDFYSLKNIQKLKIEANDFLNLKNTSLISLSVKPYNINSDNYYTNETERKIIEKIISIKTLKEINLELKILDNKELSEIHGENPSITKIGLINRKKDIDLNNFLIKFPNLSNFYLYYNTNTNSFEDKNKAQIKENANYKINKIKLNIKKPNLNLYCQSYKNLIYFDLEISVDDKNYVKNILPILNNKCKIIFKSLIYFKLISKENFDCWEIINNIFNNLDMMPNLKHFEIFCYSYIKMDFYEKFYEKIMSLNISYIDIQIIEWHNPFHARRIKKNDINKIILNDNESDKYEKYDKIHKIACNKKIFCPEKIIIRHLK